MKKILVVLCLLIAQTTCLAKMEQFQIDAQRNAINHNNRGVIHMQDRYYHAAIQEFQTAILLNPDKQSSAVYYANLANCYMKIGYPALAQDVLQKAIKLNPMNFVYYEDLTAAYKQQNILGQKLKHFIKDSAKNPLSRIMVGLILVEQGKKEAGIAKLQEFVYLEPDLIITSGIKSYINQNAGFGQ